MCVVPVIIAVADFSLAVGDPVLVNFALSAGTGPLVWSITTLPSGLTFNPATQQLIGTMPASPVIVTVTAENSCGNDTEALTITPISVAVATIRWGNFTWPGFPAAGPLFVEADFTGGNPAYVDTNAVDVLTRVGARTFATRAGVRQVMWIKNTLLTGSPSFQVSGFPWGLTPAPNTPYQSLTIAGIPGTVYFTLDQNGGTYTVNVL